MERIVPCSPKCFRWQMAWRRQMESMKHTKVSKGSATAFGQGSQGAESHPQASSWSVSGHHRWTPNRCPSVETEMAEPEPFRSPTTTLWWEGWRCSTRCLHSYTTEQVAKQQHDMPTVQWTVGAGVERYGCETVVEWFATRGMNGFVLGSSRMRELEEDEHPVNVWLLFIRRVTPVVLSMMQVVADKQNHARRRGWRTSSERLTSDL